MPESRPDYLVFVCPGCIAIRHLKPKEDTVYYCQVCGLEFDYIDGRISRRIVVARNPNGKGGWPKGT